MPSRDAAAAPARVWEFTLDHADALAWEALPSAIRGWRKFVFLLFLAAGGLWPLLLPESWDIDRHQWRILLATTVGVGLQWALATVAMTLATRRRAARRLPSPVAVRIEDHGDHLAVRERGEGRPERHASIPIERIVSVVLGARHLFVQAPPEVLILPLAAFTDLQDMARTADLWDGRSREGDD